MIQLFCDIYYGKAKALVDDKGHRTNNCGPATPVELMGLNGAPSSGSEFFVVEGEREAREIGTKLQSRVRQRLLTSKHRLTLNDLYNQIKDGLKELNIIIKSDTQGSAEALGLSLEKLSTQAVSVNIIHSAVGDITESDATLAIASNAIIVGFHVKADAKVKDICRKEKVDLQLYNIIYQAIDEIRNAMEGLLDAKIIKQVVGKAKIKQVFKLSKIGFVAGCSIIEGKITRNAKAQLIRNNEIILEDQVTSLKRNKDDAKEATKGMECGIRLGKYDAYQAGDIIEAYTLLKEEQKL